MKRRRATMHSRADHPAPAGRRGAIRAWWPMLAGLLGAVAVDQLTKIVAVISWSERPTRLFGRWCNLLLTRRASVDRSVLTLLGGQRAALLLALLTSAGLLFGAARTMSRAESTEVGSLARIGLGICCGALLSEALDQLARGGSIGFIHLSFGRFSWPPLALSSLLVAGGLALLLVSTSRSARP